MKISHVDFNNRKRVFTVHTEDKVYEMPYSKLRDIPERGNPVVRVISDPELGCEAITFWLKNGYVGAVHLDNIRAVNGDPAILTEMMLHNLTVQAQERLAEVQCSKRELARRLGTSPAQLYRLLDQTYYKKSIGQMISLLHVMGCKVDLVVRPAG